MPSKSKPTASTGAITKARVLTSTECLNIIREKDMKKKTEEEEKQKRKKNEKRKGRKGKKGTRKDNNSGSNGKMHSNCL